VCCIRGAEFLLAEQGGTLDLARSRETLCKLLSRAQNANGPKGDGSEDDGSEGDGSEGDGYDLLLDVRGLLLDVRGANADLAIKGVWTLARDLGECVPGFGRRLAILNEADETFDRMRVLETSTNQAGLEFEVRVFDDFEAAVNWLWDARTLSQ